MHACFLFGMAGALRELDLSVKDRTDLASYSIMMGWGNSIGYTLGALLGARGLQLKLDANLPPLSFFLSAMYALAKVLQLTWKGSRLQ